MTILNTETVLLALIGAYAALIGAYAYIHKIEGDMGRRQLANEDKVGKALKENSKLLSDLKDSVTDRLARIETQLDIQLPKKGADGSHQQ